MNYNTEKFKATILRDLGYVPMSESLMHRVLIVRDEYNRIKVSVQAWWLDDKHVWQPGKGYFFSGRTAKKIATYMLEALTNEGYEKTYPITNTQQYLVHRIDNKNLISVDKWWRKSEDEPWTFGKGLAVKRDKVTDLCNLVIQAGSLTLNVR